jgi:hypothetical protein
MAATAFCAPDGRHEGNRPIAMPAHSPARGSLLKQIQLNYVAAAAWADHRSGPHVRLVAGDVQN